MALIGPVTMVPAAGLAGVDILAQHWLRVAFLIACIALCLTVHAAHLVELQRGRYALGRSDAYTEMAERRLSE